MRYTLTPKLKLVKQPKGSKLCGQCCAAMITSTSLEAIQMIISKKGATTIKDIIGVLNKRYFLFENRLTTIRGITKLPKFAVLKVRWRKGGSHWVVIFGNKIYDPLLNMPKMLSQYKSMIDGKISSYLEIKLNPTWKYNG